MSQPATHKPNETQAIGGAVRLPAGATPQSSNWFTTSPVGTTTSFNVSNLTTTADTIGQQY
jgi:hypothetical protein